MKKVLLATPLLLLIFLWTSPFSFSQDKNVVDASGKRQGPWMITAAMMKHGPPWQPNQVMLEGNYKDSYRIGTWVQYNSNGDKIAEWNFDLENNNLEKKLFEHSVLVAEYNYAYAIHQWSDVEEYNGSTKKVIVPHEVMHHHGIAKTYYPNGKVQMEMTWKDGRLDGPMKTYYPSGNLCEEGTWHYNYWSSPPVHHKDN